MAEKTKNVFEKLQETLETVAEEIHMANDALYVVATETMDLSEQVSNVNTKLDALLKAIPTLIPKQTETPAMVVLESKPLLYPTTEKKVK
jgi:uncharacterized protein YoxC